MEENKKFELNDEMLDNVAGGAVIYNGTSATYNGTTWTVGQTVLVPYCSSNVFSCLSTGITPAVITGFAPISSMYLRTGELKVYLRMECCQGETSQPIKNLQPRR